MSALQGPRETMEDFASVIPHGRCGFLAACEPRSTHPLCCLTSSVPSHTDPWHSHHDHFRHLSPNAEPDTGC